ncbi:MAG: repressor LexA [Phototrophicales bacterium]|nr:MAG: repressor LexA [Phototrophicales bacterium]
MKSRKRRTGSKLSERQKKILQFIEKTYLETGFPPTIREIGEAVNIGSTSVVNYNLNKLEQAGYIKRERNVSRGLRLIRTYKDQPFNPLNVQLQEDDTNTVKVPLVGHIVASEPLELPEGNDLAYPDEEDLLPLPTSLLGKYSGRKPVFALRVNGDSMIDALVGDQDIVILEQQETAQNGDMVAVWLVGENKTTLKYFYKEGERVRLQPANATMQPIYVDARQVRIQGRVLAVIRQI